MAPPVPSRPQRYATVLIRAGAVMVLAFVLTRITGRFIADYFLPPHYVAVTEIEVAPPPAVLGGPGTMEVLAQQNEISIMRSPNVLMPIIQDLRLDHAWAAPASDQASSAKPLAPLNALGLLSQLLKIETVPHSHLIRISVMDTTREEAAQIANAIAARYKAMRDAEEAQRHDRSVDALNDQIAQQLALIDAKKAALTKMPASGSLADLQNEVDKNQRILDALQARLQQVVAEHGNTSSAVRVVKTAEAPVRPMHRFAYIATNLFAVIVAITAMCFVEMVMLFRRAGQRDAS